MLPGIHLTAIGRDLDTFLSATSSSPTSAALGSTSGSTLPALEQERKTLLLRYSWGCLPRCHAGTSAGPPRCSGAASAQTTRSSAGADWPFSQRRAWLPPPSPAPFAVRKASHAARVSLNLLTAPSTCAGPDAFSFAGVNFPLAGVYQITADGATSAGDVANRTLLCVAGAPAMGGFSEALRKRCAPAAGPGLQLRVQGQLLEKRLENRSCCARQCAC